MPQRSKVKTQSSWRRLATRYDKLAATFASAIFIAAIIT
jgi:transposase